MIDPALLRENPDAIKASQRARGADESLVDDAANADVTWRKALLEFENLRAEQNAASKLVAAAPKEEKAALVASMQELSARVKAADAAAKATADKIAAEAVATKAAQDLAKVLADKAALADQAAKATDESSP